ncbi:MAG: class I SAM-dependent methyltransferase [Trichocoleus desertorum ATA4-8-CV12]|jgi:SAM-dependent methyltransferase|nr:class I SAM-dependent methyltransferase [Trichocoleus desertorum ATA4-8-CV12]
MQLQRIFLLFASVGVVSLGTAACTQQRNFEADAQSSTQTNTTTVAPTAQPQGRQADVPFVPTPPEVVTGMLELAKVGPNDVLYDLGSGDGRIVIAAAKEFGTRGTGIDINPELVQQSRENAQQAGVGDRTRFLQQDLFETDLSDATVVTLYLLPDVNLKLRPKLLRELKPGTRIVSHAFDMGDWKPERVEQIQGRTIYYWVVPEQIPANLQ